MLRSHIRTPRIATALALASLVFLTGVSPAHAQATTTAPAVSKDTAAAVKAAFAADLDTLQQKFVGLAEAFPQDKYTWKPMDGVRSVSEVLMLAAFEGYNFIPTGFGGKGADLGTREEAAKLRTLSDKAQVIDHLKKGFAHAKAQLDAVDPATLTGAEDDGPRSDRHAGGALHRRRSPRASRSADRVRADEPHRSAVEQVKG